MALFVKLETTWADHPKIIAAGMAGRGLHATALCISKRLETDGWIDRALLYREGADDQLIDRLVELHLLDTEGTRVRPHHWHDRNPSQGAIDATRSAKAEAARAGNHKRWKHPGPIADCEICAPPPQVSRISDRSGVAEPSDLTPVRSPDTDTETELLPLLKSQDYTGTGPPEPSHDEQAAAAPPDPNHVPDEQTTRRTAALVGRTVAAAQAGIGNPQGYAAGVTRQILDPQGDGIDRARIERELATGQTPEQIAATWITDPFGFASQDTPAATGPDTAGHYAALEARRREQMADQEPAPPAIALAGAAAARAALRKEPA